MKIFLHKLFKWAVFVVPVLLYIFIMSIAIEPLGNIVFSPIFGHRYFKAGVTELSSPKQQVTLSIYKKKDRPFLLVGPFDFSDDDYNFFFVNKKQVVCTANDKGGDAWVRLFCWLFVVDDLTGEDRLRVDLGNILLQPVRYDKKADAYHFVFSVSGRKEICTFDIPSKFFTPDMEKVPNIAADLIK